MTTTNGTVPPADAAYDPSHDYHALNAMLNLYDAQGRIQFDKDKAAEREYVTGHVAANTIAFPTTRQRLDYLIRNNYYDGVVFDRYSPSSWTASMRMWNRRASNSARSSARSNSMRHTR